LVSESKLDATLRNSVGDYFLNRFVDNSIWGNKILVSSLYTDIFWVIDLKPLSGSNSVELHFHRNKSIDKKSLPTQFGREPVYFQKQHSRYPGRLLCIIPLYNEYILLVKRGIKTGGIRLKSEKRADFSFKTGLKIDINRGSSPKHDKEATDGQERGATCTGKRNGTAGSTRKHQAV